MNHKNHLIITINLLILFFISSSLCVIKAFNEREFYALNIGLPTLSTLIKAIKKDAPIFPALIKTLVGGILITNTLKHSKNAEFLAISQLWKNKLRLNIGASIIESATNKDFSIRMDLGPWWIIYEKNRFSTKIGMHSAIITLLNRLDGSKPSFKQSLKYGTVVYNKPRNFDGTIGKGGALAYSNANNIILNNFGQHAGHEVIHVYQYRRDNAILPTITSIFPALKSKMPSLFIDDSAWLVNWCVQMIYAKLSNIDSSFEIPLEKEAYYLADDISF